MTDRGPGIVAPGLRTGRIELHILGPVEVRVDDRTAAIGGPKSRALLADLILHANRTVSVEQLVADLWGDDPPLSASKMIQILVSRLRRVIDEDPTAPTALLRRPTGYELKVGDDSVDELRFEAIVRAADALMPADTARAASLYRSALDLWRGPALSDVRYEPFAAAPVARLEELRLRTFESWADAELALGHHLELVADLRGAVTQEPLRERLCGQLMLALYRSGRQGDALQLYVDTRRRLVDELGVEPSGGLNDLQVAILNQDVALDLPDGRNGRLAADGDEGTDGDLVAFDLPSRSRRVKVPMRVILALGIASAVVLAGAGYAAVGMASPTQPPSGLTVVGDSLAILDTVSERIVADVRVGSKPGPVGLDDQSAWVGNVADRTLSQVDRTSHFVLKTFGLTNAPTSVAAGAGGVWVGNGFDGTLTRILPQFGQQTGPIFPSGRQSGLLAIAASSNALWVGLPNKELDRIDPASLEATTKIALSARAQAMVPEGSTIWYISGSDPMLHEVDPANLTGSRLVQLPGDAAAIGAGSGSIWVATVAPDDLVEIDRVSAEIKQTIVLPTHPMAIAVGASAVWVVTMSGQLSRIDMTSHEIRTDDLGHPIEGLALSGSELWLTLR